MNISEAEQTATKSGETMKDAMHIEIDLNEKGFGSVKINGEEWANRIMGLRIDANPNDFIRVSMTLAPAKLSLRGVGKVITEPAEIVYEVSPEDA